MQGQEAEAGPLEPPAEEDAELLLLPPHLHKPLQQRVGKHRGRVGGGGVWAAAGAVRQQKGSRHPQAAAGQVCCRTLAALPSPQTPLSALSACPLPHLAHYIDHKLAAQAVRGGGNEGGWLQPALHRCCRPCCTSRLSRQSSTHPPTHPVCRMLNSVSFLPWLRRRLAAKPIATCGGACATTLKYEKGARLPTPSVLRVETKAAGARAGVQSGWMGVGVAGRAAHA